MSDIINLKPFTLFKYSLSDKKNIEKVKIAQILYGRNKDGLIKKESGSILGKGAFIVPVEKEEIFKEALNTHKVKYSTNRVLINS